MSSGEKHDFCDFSVLTEIINIAELVLPSRDLIQTPLGSTPFPPLGAWDTPALLWHHICPFLSLFCTQWTIGIHPSNALFLLPDLLAIRSAIRISVELIINSRGTESSPLCWESVVWKMDIPSLSETQTSILKCNYPETLHELPGNSNQHDALTWPIHTSTFSVWIWLFHIWLHWLTDFKYSINFCW